MRCIHTETLIRSAERDDLFASAFDFFSYTSAGVDSLRGDTCHAESAKFKGPVEELKFLLLECRFSHPSGLEFKAIFH